MNSSGDTWFDLWCCVVGLYDEHSPYNAHRWKAAEPLLTWADLLLSQRRPY